MHSLVESLLIVLVACGGYSMGREGSDNEGSPHCRSTYYIHEYHVHATQGADGNATGKPRDVITKDPFGKALVPREELSKEKAQLEKQLEELQSLLIEEKTKRLQQMSEFMDWTRRLGNWDKLQTNSGLNQTSLDGGIRLLNDVAKNLSGMVRSEQQQQQQGNKLQIIIRDPPKRVTLPTPPPTPAESRAKTRVSSSHRKKQGNATVKDGDDDDDDDDEEKHKRDKDDNSTRSALMEEFMEDVKKEMAGMQKALDRMSKRYIHLHKTNRRLTFSHKRLERECRKTVDICERLQNFHKGEVDDQIQKLKWKLGNESDLWQAGLKDVQSDMVCLRDTGTACGADVKETKVLVPITTTIKPDNLVAASLPISQNDTPMTTADVIQDGTKKVGDLQQQGGKVEDPQLVMMVDAGVKVSQWYMDQVVNQRPKDCSDIDFWVQRKEPVQTIYLLNKTLPVKVLCDEGWTVIQKNIYTGAPLGGSEPDKTWEDYRIGFGDLSPDSDSFWIGNQYLHWLTKMNTQDYQLRIDMRRQSDYYYVYSEYAFFQVSKESEWYRLAVGDYGGTTGDILGLFSTTDLTHAPFATPERSISDQYGFTARTYHVGWWYPSTPSQIGAYDTPDPCFTNLNTPSPWYCHKDDGAVHVASVAMKIKPS